MAVTSNHIWYPEGGDSPAYDLRKIVSWHEPSPNPNGRVKVRFIGDPVALVDFDLSDFETAKQNSLDNGG